MTQILEVDAGAGPGGRVLAAGPAGMGDEELVAVVLGPGKGARRADAVARELVGGPEGLRFLGGLSATELACRPGVGATRAARLVAALELGRRLVTVRLPRGAAIRSSGEVFRHYHPQMRRLTVEQFRVLVLDGKHRVVREHLVSQGTLTSSPVHPREVFGPAIRHAAAALVLVHNHPSGDPAPSADDLDITRRLADVGELVGIRILDHVIVGEDSYVSLADRGLLHGG